MEPGNTLYWSMGIFIFIIAYFLIQFSIEVTRGFFILLIIAGATFILFGILLLDFSRSEKGKLKIFLIITGVSAISPLVFTILHNVFYGLAITFENLSFIFNSLHIASFLISLVIAPITYLIGFIGSIIILKKERR